MSKLTLEEKWDWTEIWSGKLLLQETEPVLHEVEGWGTVMLQQYRQDDDPDNPLCQQISIAPSNALIPDFVDQLMKDYGFNQDLFSWDLTGSEENGTDEFIGTYYLGEEGQENA